MKRIFLALVLLAGLAAPLRAQLTTITASSIKMAGVPVASGTVTFIPTNYTGQAIAITAGGTLYDAQGFTANLTNGAIVGTLQVPNACTASPAVANTQMYYAVRVFNSVTQQSFTLTRVDGVCGATWALDGYVPTQGAPVTATGILSGTTVPARCVGASIFYTLGSPVSVYNCVSGIYVVQASGASPSSGFVTRGLTALYLFNEGAGATVAHDSSGANSCSGAPCDLSLTGGTAPQMTTQGLNLVSVSASGGGSQYYVVIPSAIQAFKSVTIGSYVAPLSNGQITIPTAWSSVGQDGNNYWTFLSAATGGWRIMAGPDNRSFGSNGAIVGGSTITQIVDTWMGYGTHTYVVGSGSGDKDHIYYNGSEGNYLVQGFSTGLQTGTMYLGNAPQFYPSFPTGFPGIIPCLAFYSVQLTAAEAAQNHAACTALAASRGVTVKPIYNPQTTNQITCTGDSINGTIGSTNTICSQLSGLNDTYTATANGLSGWTCKAVQDQVLLRDGLLFSPYAGKSVAFVECGINDVASGLTTTQAVNALMSLGLAMRQAGASKVFVSTYISISGTLTDSSFKNAMNPLVRAAATQYGFGLVDWASIPQLGADGSYSNATYFLGDGVHPTNTGKALMAAVMSNALNEAYGSTLAGGCTKTVTAATYTEAAADGCVRVDTTSNAVALTLPSCNGYFQPRAVKNLGVNANAVTVSPASGQQIDRSSSAVTVASGSTLTLFPRVTDSTGTCQWER